LPISLSKDQLYICATVLGNTFELFLPVHFASHGSCEAKLKKVTMKIWSILDKRHASING
jgi:hypothetical protein